MGFSDLSPENIYQLLGSDGTTIADVVTIDTKKRLLVDATIGGVDVTGVLDEFALDGGGNKDLAIDGAGTPVEFTIDANAGGGADKIIKSLKLYGDDVNIKVGESNFLGNTNALTNGILIEVTKNTVTNQFRNIMSTNDFLARMSSSPEKSRIIGQSGGDFIEAVFDFADRNSQLRLVAGTTDQIKITIRDDLTGVSDLFFFAEGVLE